MGAGMKKGRSGRLQGLYATSQPVRRVTTTRVHDGSTVKIQFVFCSLTFTVVMDTRLHRLPIQSGVPTPHKRDGRQVNGFIPCWFEFPRRVYTRNNYLLSPPQSNLLLVLLPTHHKCKFSQARCVTTCPYLQGSNAAF